MRKLGPFAAFLVVAAAIGGTVIVAVAQQSPPPTGPGMMGPGMMGPGMMGRGMMGSGYGSMPRQHYAMMYGVPAPYASMTNPLPRTAATIDRGAAVYAGNCALCHGPTGAGDGAAGRTLSPPPANLAWLAQMPMVQWDPFLYWTVAEGGAQFVSAMPAFKGALSKDDIWAAIAYLQAGLPQKSR